MQSNIRKLRNEKNISQAALAKAIGKTQQTVSHMERDRNRIPVDSLIAMSEYFGVSTDYILGIEPDEKPESDSKSAPTGQEEIRNSENIKKLVDGDKKLLYQLILSILLCTLDEDNQTVTAAEGNKL